MSHTSFHLRLHDREGIVAFASVNGRVLSVKQMRNLPEFAELLAEWGVDVAKARTVSVLSLADNGEIDRRSIVGFRLGAATSWPVFQRLAADIDVLTPELELVPIAVGSLQGSFDFARSTLRHHPALTAATLFPSDLADDTRAYQCADRDEPAASSRMFPGLSDDSSAPAAVVTDLELQQLSQQLGTVRQAIAAGSPLLVSTEKTQRSQQDVLPQIAVVAADSPALVGRDDDDFFWAAETVWLARLMFAVLRWVSAGHVQLAIRPDPEDQQSWVAGLQLIEDPSFSDFFDAMVAALPVGVAIPDQSCLQWLANDCVQAPLAQSIEAQPRISPLVESLVTHTPLTQGQPAQLARNMKAWFAGAEFEAPELVMRIAERPIAVQPVADVVFDHIFWAYAELLRRWDRQHSASQWDAAVARRLLDQPSIGDMVGTLFAEGEFSRDGWLDPVAVADLFTSAAPSRGRAATVTLGDSDAPQYLVPTSNQHDYEELFGPVYAVELLFRTPSDQRLRAVSAVDPTSAIGQAVADALQLLRRECATLGDEAGVIATLQSQRLVTVTYDADPLAADSNTPPDAGVAPAAISQLSSGAGSGVLPYQQGSPQQAGWVKLLPEVDALALVDWYANKGQQYCTLLAPKAWTQPQSLSLRVKAADSYSYGFVSASNLCKFNWQAALDGQPLTDAEFAALLAANSDMVRIRGRYVRVEKHTLTRVRQSIGSALVDPRHTPSRSTRQDIDELLDMSPQQFMHHLQAGVTTGVAEFAHLLADFADLGINVDPAGDPAEWMNQVTRMRSLLQWTRQTLANDDDETLDEQRNHHIGGLAASAASAVGQTNTVDFYVPPSITATLRDYQLQGSQWMANLSSLGVGCLLADDMGLGKTLQLLALYAWEQHEGATPAMQRRTWQTLQAAAADIAHYANLAIDEREQALEVLGPQFGVGAHPVRCGILLAEQWKLPAADVASGQYRPGMVTDADSPPAPIPSLPMLVVAPKTVQQAWEEQLATFFPTARCYVHHGANRLHGIDLLQQLGRVDVVITTYETLRRDQAELVGPLFSRVVFDEAQAIKNAHSRNFRAAERVCRQHTVIATGTPVENSLQELWAHFRQLNPGVLGGEKQFRASFVTPIQHAYAAPVEVDSLSGPATPPVSLAGNPEDYDLDVSGRRHTARQHMERLRGLIEPYVLRRTKNQLDLGLKNKTIEVVEVPLTPEQIALYHQVVTDFQTKADQATTPRQRNARIFALLSELRQICNHPAIFLPDDPHISAHGHYRSNKLAAIEQLAQRCAKQGRRMLVFTSSVPFGTMLAELLTAVFGEPIAFFHGQLSAQERRKIIRTFQSPNGPAALVLTPKTGGSGITLTNATMVIHADLWWNPAVLEQANDRAYRIGQHHDVEVFYVVANFGIEQYMLQLLDSKRDLADFTLQQSAASQLSAMNRQELAAVLHQQSANHHQHSTDTTESGQGQRR
ncbi:DEAD/DEAH box helicase [Corynebacterium choanae]|uniref:RNA polymerase-associated protein RapA n=1 Tax=Corynebacterium choanae TaxID=1862358 RepID=A0A3G6J5R7_9CORY|nr:DEAD/DEAH box helicase [Corynebacterium choanae]AZA13289.1 RNA polymerase-associated protein RapA [Corynebacterium choanae]